MRGRLRLTWIELAIVVVILGVVASVAGADRASRRRERRIEENEAAAIATLRLIASAQEQFKAMRAVDVDGDGIGEYGVFREMSGAILPRTHRFGTNLDALPLASPPLPVEFGIMNRNAEVRRGGYLFKVFLPGEDGFASEETVNGSTDSLAYEVISSLATTTWCVYAWPVRRGHSGRRTFFVNEGGIVSETNFRGYSRSGALDTPQAGAALVPTPLYPHCELYFDRYLSCRWGPITGTQALGTVGRDGNFWRVAE